MEDSKEIQPPRSELRAPNFGVPQALFAGLTVIALSIYLSFGLPNKQAASSAPGPGTVAGATVSEATLVPDADDDPALGADDAPVTIIEFSDFQCPFCRAFWRETLPQIEEQYIKAGLVKFVYRDFPLPIHEAAEDSALAGECADDQGRFWEFHDKMFAAQDEQGKNTIQFEVVDLKSWAGEIGLNQERFEECLDEGRFEQEVAADLAAGQAAGVSGTPTFFINGRILAGAHPFANFQKLIDAQLNK